MLNISCLSTLSSLAVESYFQQYGEPPAVRTRRRTDIPSEFPPPDPQGCSPTEGSHAHRAQVRGRSGLRCRCTRESLALQVCVWQQEPAAGAAFTAGAG